MTTKKIIIDGEKFSTLKEFYVEMDNLLTKNLNWKTGHNLDAFNDLLRGGFNVFEYSEPITLFWINSEKSKKDFGYKATEKYYEAILKTCHPSNTKYVREDIKRVKSKQGQTLFDKIIEIIKSHEHISFIMK